ncbi:hypothetical protein ACFL6C_09085 [Myxococcota bacterium]
MRCEPFGDDDVSIRRQSTNWVAALALLAPACSTDSPPAAGKGSESALPGAEELIAADTTTVVHGEIPLGLVDEAEISAAARIHLWSFSVGAGGAAITATTRAADSGPTVDTVLYLYERRDDGRWGIPFARSDDCEARGDLFSCLPDVSVLAGEYWVMVRAHTEDLRGRFGVMVECSGLGCRAQEVDCSGVVGVPASPWDQVDISPSETVGRLPVAAPDSHGGAFVAYLEAGSGGDNVRLQRLDENGAIVFQTSGLLLAEDRPPENLVVALEADGEGGVFVVIWDEPVLADNVMVLRVGPAGEMLWGERGLDIFSERRIAKVRTISRGGGALFLVYNELTTGQEARLYAQAVGPAGNPLWQEPISVSDHATADLQALIRISWQLDSLVVPLEVPQGGIQITGQWRASHRSPPNRRSASS